MAFISNYARGAMFSPGNIRKRKKAEEAARKKENTAERQKEWVHKFILEGGDYRKAGIEYRKHLEKIAKARRESYKRWKKSKHEQNLQEQKERRLAKKNRPVQNAQVPKPNRPPERLHYRPGMSSTDFYRCWEWNTLRYQTIKRYGTVCMCCGAAGNHVDHIKPRSKFPALELAAENLQILCESCNVGKSNLYEDDWRNRGPSPSPA